MAVDASLELCRTQTERLAGPIAERRLTIINAAIAAQPRLVTFYASPMTIWGTIDREFAERNEQSGTGRNTEITVEGVEFGSLLDKHGTPWFTKIDIGGADAFTFRKGASGMFGEDAPGEWITRDQAVRAYRRIFFKYRVAGDFSPLRRNRVTKPLAQALSILMGGPWWYDTHAPSQLGRLKPGRVT